MLRKLALGLVAAASLGAMALAPTAASAGFKGCCGGWGGGGWGFHHPHWGHGIGFIGGGGAPSTSVNIDRTRQVLAIQRSRARGSGRGFCFDLRHSNAAMLEGVG
jgi:hypothetical protein